MNPSPRIDVDISSLSFDNNWPLKCFTREVEGSILEEILDYDPDIIILDFIDERYDILRVGGGYLTLAVELLMSGASEQEWFRNGERIPRLSQECYRLWTTAARNFAEFLHVRLPNAQVLIHDAPWTSVIVEGRDLSSEIPGPGLTEQELHEGNVAQVPEYDLLTKSYAGILASFLPKSEWLTIPKDLQVAARDHIWGAAPFHYVTEYYAAAVAHLSARGVKFNSLT